MIKVNLVPQEILDKEIQRQRALQASLAGVLIVLILAGVSFSHYRKKAVSERMLSEQKEKLKTLQAIVDQVNAFEAQAAAVRARLGVMNDLLKSRELYPRFMVDIIESFPDGVWIGGLTTTSKNAGLDLTMPAFASSTRDVTTWLRTLEESKLFTGAKISPILIDAKGKHSFTMQMHYIPPVLDKN